MIRVKEENKWLELRKSVITATEAPCLLGLNKYQSAAKMLKEKEVSTFKGNAYTYIGNILEPIVTEMSNKVLKRDFRVIEDYRGKMFYRHPTLPLGATPDAVEGREFLECKTTKPLNYLKYSHSPPEYYVMQLMVQLFCAGFSKGYLAIMSTDLTQHSPELKLPISIFEVKRHKRIDELLEEEVKRVWECKEEGKAFRVNSKNKIQARLLINTSYRKVK